MARIFISVLILMSLSSCAKKSTAIILGESTPPQEEVVGGDTCVLGFHPQETSYKELSPVQKKLVDAAEAVMKNSYNPYSNFYVGSAVLTLGDEIIAGTNFENAAYGSTICAERSAILRANANGKRKIKAIAIIGKGKDFDSEEVIAPCGACRQVIFETSQVSDTNIEVIMSNTKKTKILISTIEDLLPLAFGPKDLGIDLK